MKLYFLFFRKKQRYSHHFYQSTTHNLHVLYLKFNGILKVNFFLFFVKLQIRFIIKISTLFLNIFTRSVIDFCINLRFSEIFVFLINLHEVIERCFFHLALKIVYFFSNISSSHFIIVIILLILLNSFQTTTF